MRFSLKGPWDECLNENNHWYLKRKSQWSVVKNRRVNRFILKINVKANRTLRTAWFAHRRDGKLLRIEHYTPITTMRISEHNKRVKSQDRITKHSHLITNQILWININRFLEIQTKNRITWNSYHLAWKLNQITEVRTRCELNSNEPIVLISQWHD